jgi:hypothetical protein
MEFEVNIAGHGLSPKPADKTRPHKCALSCAKGHPAMIYLLRSTPILGVLLTAEKEEELLTPATPSVEMN